MVNKETLLALMSNRQSRNHRQYYGTCKNWQKPW